MREDQVKEPGDGMTVEEGVNDPASVSEEEAPASTSGPGGDEPAAPADAAMSEEGRSDEQGDEETE